MAELNSCVYIVCCDSSTIIVFNVSDSFQRVEDIEVPGLRDATDMAVCRDTGQLYVVDKFCCVWKIRPADRQVVRYTNGLWKWGQAFSPLSHCLKAAPSHTASGFATTAEKFRGNKVPPPGCLRPPGRLRPAPGQRPGCVSGAGGVGPLPQSRCEGPGYQPGKFLKTQMLNPAFW